MKITRASAIITCTSKTKTPKVEKVQVPEEQDKAVVAARDSERSRRRAAASKTFLSGFQQASPASAGAKTLLGS